MYEYVNVCVNIYVCVYVHTCILFSLFSPLSLQECTWWYTICYRWFLWCVSTSPPPTAFSFTVTNTDVHVRVRVRLRVLAHVRVRVRAHVHVCMCLSICLSVCLSSTYRLFTYHDVLFDNSFAHCSIKYSLLQRVACCRVLQCLAVRRLRWQIIW